MSSISMNSVFMKTTHNSYLPETFKNQPNNNNGRHDEEDNNQKIQQVWSKHNFETCSSTTTTSTNGKMTENVIDSQAKMKMMTWAEQDPSKHREDELMVTEEIKEENRQVVDKICEISHGKEEETSPSHHARRPMNAFLIFCKKHRPIVRQKFPSLENRGVTRILGEWWAQLDIDDKKPYTDLAREYKDAFLSANPDFRWYKLPAPPLRSLSVRPNTNATNLSKVSSPVSSPHNDLSPESEFTPGKLADESQLGSLTSLMNNNFSSGGNINNNNIEQDYESPVNLIKTTAAPPKPIKKRIVFDNDFDGNHVNDGKKSLVARNLQLDDDCNDLTNQDFFNKVVDKMFPKAVERKSGRQCKGKRYEQFMFEGRLLGNKRDAKLTSQKSPNCDDSKTQNETETPNLLDHTIKRLAERTNMRNLLDVQVEVKKSEDTNNDNTNINNNNNHKQASDFNLDLRIKNLLSLSYEVFSQRKKESKKRKNRNSGSEQKSKFAKMEKSPPAVVVGSKKRKNKQSITHLEKKNDQVISCELLGLATLAEVAANTEKINESTK